jgi:serine/threonine protein kinase
MLSNGHQIGSYRIVEPIAGGGMGMVYVAEHVTFQERVAIKALMDSLAMNERVRFRFEQEAYVQRQLSHPNIVEVKDFITVGGTLVIVMELVDGPSLFQEMEQERRGMWPVEGAMAIMGPVLDAVAYAHARGVVHRDLKPANVLLDRTGGQAWPGIPKITDFGVAKILSTKSGMTRTGSQLGTFGYMAPEQYRGNLDTDARADVFALGMMIWRLLAGRLPVDVEDMVALTQMYAGQEPIPDIRTINKQVPEAFAASLARALAIDPAQRPADAGELARALVAAPVSPASQPPPARRRSRRCPIPNPHPAAAPACPRRRWPSLC